MRLDFGAMDFREFFTELVKTLKMPNAGDINSRVKSGLPNIQTYKPHKTDNGLGLRQKNIPESEEYK
jgi:hypothetical protein